MNASTVIAVENLSQAYPVYNKPADILLELLTRKSRHNLFWALREVSFTVQEKQRVGIIGPNGSGKTTLLKLITGNLSPTSGTVKVHGKVSAMLSLATAINPEETGLNNIRFHLIMHGCSPAVIPQLTEEIVDFAELGPFIYAPVKTYSAGMNARLAFAMATSITPEILVIDEVLGAGDGYFIGKATQRMIDLCNRGRALVFVSHSIAAVQMLCDTAIWLDNGSIRTMGPVDYVTKLYEEDYRRREDEATRSGNMARQKAQPVHRVHLSEVDEEHLHRLRIVSQNEQRSFKDTHYVRRITLSGAGTTAQDISLSLVDMQQQDVVAALDLLGSEWGRLYSKDGNNCRILCSQTGKTRGGHILLKKSAIEASLHDLQVTIEFSSLNGEEIGVEFLNYETTQWEQAEIVTYKNIKDDWKAITVNLSVPQIDQEQYQQAIQKIEQESKSPIEIIDISVVVDETVTHTVGERQPFEIRVQIIANKYTPQVDVGIKIMRSDGVYVFWQSSGIDGNNLHDVEGIVTVRFLFHENYLAAGEYEISVYCANGWDLSSNYPYSEVFDRQVNGCKFSVQREFPMLDFGQINMRVPVLYEKMASQD